MTDEKRPIFTRWRGYFAVISLLSLLSLLVIAACFQYYTKLQETVRAESAAYLQEISKQIGTNADKTIEDNFAMLGTVATMLSMSDARTFDQLGGIMREQQLHWSFERLLLVGADGVAYDPNGHAMLLDSDAYLQKAIVEGKRSMSTSQLMGETECVVFAVPLENLLVEGHKMAALVATYDLSTFDQILSITAFNGSCYGHIIRRDGAVVIRSSSPTAPQTGYNLLASLEQAQFSGGTDAKAVLSHIARGEAGQAELCLDGEPLLMAYTPLGGREWYLLTFVPVAVATEKSALFLHSTLLIGVLVALVFSLLLAVILSGTYRHKRRLERLAFVDPVTGGSTIQHFYARAAALLAASDGGQYALVYTNIAKFKLLNEQLGRTACDTILKTANDSIGQTLDSGECMGRLFADNFCVLLRYWDEPSLAARLKLWNENYNSALGKCGVIWLPLVVEMGVYVLEDRAMAIPDMVDRAKLALRETPRELDALVHYTIYDERVRRRLLREKQLEDMMAQALEQHEFQVYLQPKYSTRSEEIGGAEALVRWMSAKEGMIYPDEFISLFEKNGFILQLDRWVFQRVCLTLRTWLDAGHKPMRISVNCSRITLKTPGFLTQYKAIADRCAIPPELLEIELTENVVFEDVIHLTRIIEEIHACGFSCSMDDFGSGYSSLNLIRDIPVDVLKLDRVFFRSGPGSSTRTESVVSSILSMARALSMETVAEGVEERQQLEMLKRLGCDYIQGYYFAKPMPIPDFEALAFGAASTARR